MRNMRAERGNIRSGCVPVSNFYFPEKERVKNAKEREGLKEQVRKERRKREGERESQP